MQGWSTLKISTTKASGKRTRCRVAIATSVAMTEDVGSYCIRNVEDVKESWIEMGYIKTTCGPFKQPSSNGKKVGSSCNVTGLIIVLVF